jgi:hypothetical protein
MIEYIQLPSYSPSRLFFIKYERSFNILDANLKNTLEDAEDDLKHGLEQLLYVIRGIIDNMEKNKNEKK